MYINQKKLGEAFLFEKKINNNNNNNFEVCKEYAKILKLHGVILCVLKFSKFCHLHLPPFTPVSSSRLPII
jgi:hypothetical protein